MHPLHTNLKSMTNDKEDWFPPLEKVLEDITLEQAVWKPADGTMNSIWELVCHLLFYGKRLLMRFLGETANEPQAEDNGSTFRLPIETFQNWKETKQEHEDLYRQIPGERSLVLELKSLAMHDAYHFGQIVFLSKMQGAAWAAKRSF
ncbi:DinB family protein [Priestia megaterium]|uniref:DinB family protein n=1 Tax=Priestia megaterium TaxID=1404 RepID=UPI0024535666|nr:DinB family protein [Priestia megaterium]MDH3155921.1 DinB family protein [Priestia megaterium]MED4116309.1 DinB family protein [Priestia megaterium]